MVELDYRVEQRPSLAQEAHTMARRKNRPIAVDRPRPDVSPDTQVVRLLVPMRVWNFLEGTQAYADLRAIGAGADRVIPADEAVNVSLIKQMVEAPVTRKDRRFYVWVTEAEAVALRRYVEAMQAGAGDNTRDEDGRADLFSATKFLEQMTKAGV